MEARALLTRLGLWLHTLAPMAIALATGCEQGRSAPAGAAGTASSGQYDASLAARMHPADAITSIASARCERASACNRIGPGKEFADYNACRAAFLARLREDLAQRECPDGIGQKELNECLADIWNEGCGNPWDEQSRLINCRTRNLCPNKTF